MPPIGYCATIPATMILNDGTASEGQSDANRRSGKVRASGRPTRPLRMTQGRVEERRIPGHGPLCPAAFYKPSSCAPFFLSHSMTPSLMVLGMPYRHWPLETLAPMSMAAGALYVPGSLAAFSLARRGA